MKIEVFSPFDQPPAISEEFENTSGDIGVIVEDEDGNHIHLNAFFDDKNKWWVHFGGVSCAHRITDPDEILYWYHLNKYEQ